MVFFARAVVCYVSVCSDNSFLIVATAIELAASAVHFVERYMSVHNKFNKNGEFNDHQRPRRQAPQDGNG